tara:strand:- start:780 stop:1154 length:375 start_codon:yes stop_codon:yes gene_type:complete
MARTDDDIITQIKELIEEQVKPAVAGHGGTIEFTSYTDGHLLLELGGACSGCAGSTATLRQGVEQMIKHYVPEVTTVDAEDGVSDVQPYYNDFDMNDYSRFEPSHDYHDHDVDMIATDKNDGAV